MNKLFTKIASLALSLTMAFGVGVALASSGNGITSVSAATNSTQYKLISSINDLEVGKSYIFTNGTSGTVTTMSTTSNTNNRKITTVAVSNQLIQRGASVLSATLGGSSGAWTFKTENYGGTSGYFASGTGSNNHLKVQSTADKCTISFNNSAAVITFSTNPNGRNILRFNSGSSLFACYSSGQSPVYLWKEVSDAKVTGLSLTPSNVSLGVGATQQLTPTITPSNATNKTLNYETSDDSIATVNSNGLITAKSAGSATITATTTDGSNISAECLITVTAPINVTGISLQPTTLKLEVGSNATITPIITPSDASNKSVGWESSDTNVATVLNGVVTAVGKGSATVTATTVDGGFKASCNITTTAPTSTTFTAGTDTGSSSGEYSSSVSKGGITIHCTSFNNSGDQYRFYANSTITISSTVGEIVKIQMLEGGDGSKYLTNIKTPSSGELTTSNTELTWVGSATSVTFKVSAQARTKIIVVTLATQEPSVEVHPSSTSNTTLLKGDFDSSIKLLIKNIDNPSWSFTYDENEQTGLTTSNYITVSPSTIVDNVATLTISGVNVGSTKIHISVSGTECDTAIDVTINAKPASLCMDHDEIIDGTIKVATGKYKTVGWTALDTDGNDYPVESSAITAEILSGAEYITASSGSGRINGLQPGTAVVKYSLAVLPSVSVELTVIVLDDYATSVKEITFNEEPLTAIQGETVNFDAVFANRLASTYFDYEMQIADEQLLFSYDENSFEDALAHNVFAYDFDHGETVDEQHKLQTIYVYVTFDESYITSYQITVEAATVELTGITVKNAIDENVNVCRNQSVQLEIEYNPSNTTTDRTLAYEIVEAEEEHTISISDDGLVSAGSALDKSVLVRIYSIAKPTIETYITITTVLEEMTVVATQDTEWTLVTDASELQDGDKIVITDTNSKYALTAYSSGNNCKATDVTANDNKLNSVQDSNILTLEAGEGNNAFYIYDGAKYLYAASKDSNRLQGQNSKNNNGLFTFSTTDSGKTMSIVANSSTNRNVMQFNANNGSPIFNCYGSASQTALKVYKLTGGDETIAINSDLIIAIESFNSEDNFTCDPTGKTFDYDAWANNGIFTDELISKYSLSKVKADENGNEVEQFLYRYDSIIEKYGKNVEDFLGRYAENGINKSINISSANHILNNSNNFSLILVVSIMTILLVGTYSLYSRKRKEQE